MTLAGWALRREGGRVDDGLKKGEPEGASSSLERESGIILWRETWELQIEYSRFGRRRTSCMV